MNCKQVNTAILIGLLCVWSPWFMAAFDKDKPASSTSLRNSNPEILANWAAIETALGANHEFSTGGSNTGNHDSIVLIEAADIGTGASGLPILGAQTVVAPELVYTDEGDNDVQLTSGGSMGSATTNTLTNTITATGLITANAGVTLGAGDDLIGSATSDINIGSGNFTVAGDSGNTLVGGTLDIQGTTAVVGVLDEDDLTSDSATNLATQQSIKAYVDLDSTGSVMHDAEGGFTNADVDGVKTKVYTKYITGTLDASSSKNVAHGITGIDNILGADVIVFNSTTSSYWVTEIRQTSSGVANFSATYDGTNVIFIAVGTQFQSQKFRIRLDYKL
ncbi:hypothetical protein LCGC14_0362230 [marine sediment metagenome]|uniref:Uncharacterized protein n=1 Tax=marine sediment metagenome TaxID=412755 RepID=A0A0F9T7Q6_9ZZZZ